MFKGSIHRAEQRYRAADGGLIDRSRLYRFNFDGRAYTGFAGDTLASALLANGVRLLGRSFKYHRPRGIVATGVEEPNAMVAMRSGARTEPNVRATQVELYDGLEAYSQNRWPSLEFDIGGINNKMSRFLPAGFYYKTFMWPASAWMLYERVIRRAAGLGSAPTQADPDKYGERNAFCDALVIGAGPAGLNAARVLGHSGARVILVDDRPRFGGTLCFSDEHISGQPAMAWVSRVEAELREMPNVRLMHRACAFGYYDQNLVAVSEHVADNAAQPAADSDRQRLWWVRAREVILATGSLERPLVFAGNDCPGVMLASAVSMFANQYAVRCGERAVVFTNNDSGYASARALHKRGVPIELIVDARASGPGAVARSVAEEVRAEVMAGAGVVGTHGYKQLEAVDVAPLLDGGTACGTTRTVPCDLLSVSGGYSPSVHLFSQSQGRLKFDAELCAFVPGETRAGQHSTGAARGEYSLNRCLADGVAVGRASAAALDLSPANVDSGNAKEIVEAKIEPLWRVPRPSHSHAKRFVDLQNDVTSDDVDLAVREGYHSVEHLKRYTTLGMGTDQGRTSNVNGLAILAGALGKEIPEVGTTTFRPPFAPVTLGTLAGREVGEDFMPVRLTPMHDWHIAAGAPMVDAGLWKRAQVYPRSGESMQETIDREVLSVRGGVGIVDVSTLGKIDVQGRDAAEFLERVYINRWKNLRIGRCRYGLMLREDGFVLDDGTTTRVAEHEYYMTTTTAQAAPVLAHLEFYAQTVWPDLDVHLTSVSDQWAGMALAGPLSREVLALAVDGADVSDAALPFMGYLETHINGFPVRLFRMTFSGELAYEVHVAADFGTAVWEAILAAGAGHSIVPYGTEAMSVMRIEKGHVVGAELDGRTIPGDFGFERMQRKDSEFIGKRSLDRDGLKRRRKTLVGLKSQDGRRIPRGAQLVWNPTAPHPVKMLGFVTSQCYSPTIEAPIALALLEDGAQRHGETLCAASPLANEYVPVSVCDPVFVDPKGERHRG